MRRESTQRLLPRLKSSVKKEKYKRGIRKNTPLFFQHHLKRKGELVAHKNELIDDGYVGKKLYLRIIINNRKKIWNLVEE